VKVSTAEEYDVLPIAVKAHQGRKTPGSHAFQPQATGNHAFTPRTTGNFNQPFAQQARGTHNVSSMQSYQPQATGNYAAPPVPPGGLSETTDLEQLEQKFWALMRILARKGLITKEEFLRELKQD